MRRPSRPRTSDAPSRLAAEPRLDIPLPPALGPALCRDLSRALGHEWLVTNGLGGYASSTIVGANTRRYHGLLVAATRPPGGRAVLLAKLEETVVMPGARYDLSTNRYPGVIHPEGYQYQEQFRMDPWPTFVYRLPGLVLEKQVCMLPQENTTVVSYTLRQASGAIELLLRPLIACRDFRWVSQENATFQTRVEQGPGTLVMHPYEGLPPLVLHHGAELFEPAAYWYKHFEYLEEVATEEVHDEDLYSPGQLLYLLRPGEAAQLIASTTRIPASHWSSLVPRATEWRVEILRRPLARGFGPLTTWLVHAADQVLVKALDGTRHVIAGYPDQPVSGRELLIGLPGLALATDQQEVARDLLQTMASHCRDGLLPVRFTEEDGSPEYDSVDTSLWLFWAVDRYVRATGDVRFVGRRLLDVLMDIVDYYVQGTQFHILMDQDGLITTEGEELPLTWMDARVEGHPVTRRAGKAVEVAALWHHALMTMADLGERFRLRLRRQYARLARLVRANAVRLLWNPDRGGFFDVVGVQWPPREEVVPRPSSQRPDEAVRPNQLIAAGLPYPLVARPQARQIVDLVGRELLTRAGLRSLSPGHPDYRGQWTGTQGEREMTRHQGCAWPWLFGMYANAYVLAYGPGSAVTEHLRGWILGFRDRWEGGWMVPELSSGDEPHQAGGSIVHATAVAELLRVLAEHELTSL